MKTIKAFIDKHPVPSYYALVFAISWGGILLVAGLGPGGVPATKEQVETLMPFALLALFAGPSVAGILMTGLLYGRAGFGELGSRLRRWRVGARWWAAAPLIAPLVFAVVFLGLSLISPEFLPRIVITDDKVSLVLMGIAIGLPVGILEELGWTGFAIPRMRLRYGVLTTGLFVGVLWQAWHLLQGYWSNGVTSGEISLALWLSTWLVGALVGYLVAFRMLMVWVYEHTGSLLVAMLMHTSLVAATFILFPPLAVTANLISGFACAAGLWVVVAVLTVATRGHLSRRSPLRGRVA